MRSRLLPVSVYVFAVLLAAVVASARTASPGLASSPAEPNTVTITNFKFEPKVLTVPVDTTVTWVNQEGAHTVSADKGEFTSPNLRAGQNFTFKFPKAGKYAYHCAFHGSSGGGNMAGTIVVTAAKKTK